MQLFHKGFRDLLGEEALSSLVNNGGYCRHYDIDNYGLAAAISNFNFDSSIDWILKESASN